MKKRIIITTVFILALLIGIFSVIPINKNYDNKPWMSNLPDDKLISEMSIPGTHDSGATHSIFDVSGKCQELSIESQLKIGVRFFDIRLQLDNNSLKVVHSFVDQKLLFSKVMYEINSYIKENKSEFIIISIKEEAESKNSIISFYNKLIDDLKKYDCVVLDNKLPKSLGEARGNIYILNRFSSSTEGIPAYDGWRDSTTFQIGNLYIQDNYCIDNIEVKKEDIINTIKYSNQKNGDTILNYTSCYLDYGFPPTYAVTSAKEINKWLTHYLSNSEEVLGIFIVYFITEEISQLIYMRN